MKIHIKSSISQNISIALMSGIITGGFNYFIIQKSIGSFIVGILMGVVIFLTMHVYSNSLHKKLTRNIPIYLGLILSSTITFVVVLFWVLVILILVNVESSKQILPFIRIIFRSYELKIGMIYGFTIGFILNMVVSIKEIIGTRTLISLFIGAYTNPREEERIFMFLDLKSSTTIAEKLGNKAFLNFLNDFFYIASDSIAKSKGSIYKYVGDEIIISWTMRKGLKNARCIECFFDIDKHVKKQQHMFQKKYNLLPEFKAGIHKGMVVAGELGYSKKEITYIGDVLNTTARIEGLCNQYDKKLLASGDLISSLPKNNKYQVQSLGNIQLKGKENSTEIYSVTEK